MSAEHLFLGLLWENSWLVEPLLARGNTVKALRREIERVARSTDEKLPTSVEMRLAEPARLALSFAEEESDRLLSETIEVPHLLLGLLRTPNTQTTRLLKQFGLEVDEVRRRIAEGTISPIQEPFGGVVCTFYGIQIRFDPLAEAPKVIADYRGHIAVIELDPAKVTQGKLPARAESMVLEWVALRKAQIEAAWKAGKAGKTMPHISPLE